MVIIPTFCPSQGMNGTMGEKGMMGEPGVMGPPGRKGTPGDAGPPGMTGDSGPPGAIGAPGDQGDPGDPGADGMPGPQGMYWCDCVVGKGRYNMVVGKGSSSVNVALFQCIYCIFFSKRTQTVAALE